MAIDKTLTQELADEGLVREITHRLQGLRRNANFEIADSIITYFEADEHAERVISIWQDYIQRETLSTNLVKGFPDDGTVTSESYKLEGHIVNLGVKKA